MKGSDLMLECQWAHPLGELKPIIVRISRSRKCRILKHWKSLLKAFSLSFLNANMSMNFVVFVLPITAVECFTQY